MKGIDQKEYIMKELLYWYNNKNEYYTSTKNNYLLLKFEMDKIENERKYLKFGLEISKILKRIFILPSFNCGNCTTSRKEPNKCNFLSFYSIRTLNKLYGIENYRENVFNFNINSLF